MGLVWHKLLHVTPQSAAEFKPYPTPRQGAPLQPQELAAFPVTDALKTLRHSAAPGLDADAGEKLGMSMFRSLGVIKP